jgi:hypothetical protein
VRRATERDPMTTIDSITKSQVLALRTEAILAGDSIMVDTCDMALGHWSDQPPEPGEASATDFALTECVSVIRHAEAQS